MRNRWRCTRCGHEIVMTPAAEQFSSRIPRCHACETVERLYPSGPRITVAQPMEQVR
jgi:NAD-dependent SIR2 family protein deacetylase